jgi:hypothetical protein
VRKLSGANPFLGLSPAPGAIVSLFFDPSPPGAGGTANDAALIVIDTEGNTATFASNGSRTGFLGDIPATMVVSRGVDVSASLQDPLANLQYLAAGAVVSVYKAGSPQTAQDEIFGPLLPVTNGLALDRTR